MPARLTAEDIDHLRRLILEAPTIAITTHKSPDGDAMGSSLAMYHWLRSLGKEVAVVVPDDIPEFLRWLPGAKEALIFSDDPERASSVLGNAALIFSMDYNNLSRTGRAMETALRTAQAAFVLIDHHREPETFARVTYSDILCGSTAELVYRLLESAGDLNLLTKEVATCIYCGILTDSGSFRFPSVTPETHRIAANLMEAGVDQALVYRSIYDNNQPDRLKLVGFALSQKLEVLADCATAYISLTTEELNRFHYRPGDTEDLVNQGLSIGGIKLAAFFREGNGEVKVSFRSKSSFDVNVFARNGWNGGGHLNAAGGSTREPLNDALLRFREQVVSLQNQIIHS